MYVPLLDCAFPCMCYLFLQLPPATHYAEMFIPRYNHIPDPSLCIIGPKTSTATLLAMTDLPEMCMSE